MELQQQGGKGLEQLGDGLVEISLSVLHSFGAFMGTSLGFDFFIMLFCVITTEFSLVVIMIQYLI